MPYRILADLVVLVHLAFIVFALLGGLLALRWHWAPWAHLPALAWASAVEFFGWICPLTPLENLLRQANGASGYTGGFIERYLMPILYPADLTREIQIALGSVLIALNVAVYLAVWSRSRARSVRGRE